MCECVCICIYVCVVYVCVCVVYIITFKDFQNFNINNFSYNSLTKKAQGNPVGVAASASDLDVKRRQGDDVDGKGVLRATADAFGNRNRNRYDV